MKKAKERKKTNKEYNILWKAFLEQEPEFREYMKYGRDEIEKNIGIHEFIDFMGWSDINDIRKYKTDALKAIPCCHCGKHMTTFQADLGLCDECKSKYDIELLNDQINTNEEKEPGTAFSTITLFVYFPEFRNLYLKEKDFNTTIIDCVEIDNLSGSYTHNFLINTIIRNNLIDEFFKVVENSFDVPKLNSKTREKYDQIKLAMSQEDAEKQINKIFEIKGD